VTTFLCFLLRFEINQLFSNTLASSTQRVYIWRLDLFNGFRFSKGFGDQWPVPVDHLVSFIAYVSKLKLSHSTISSY
jgi:hypothetical protein